MSAAGELWCVYEKPRDYPNHYVARRFVGGQPTGFVILCPSLKDLRDCLQLEGLAPVPRDADDEPQIVESWI